MSREVAAAGAAVAASAAAASAASAACIHYVVPGRNFAPGRFGGRNT